MNKKKLQQNLKTLLLTMTLGTGLIGEYKITSDIVVSQHQQKLQEELEQQANASFPSSLNDIDLDNNEKSKIKR